MANQIEKLPDSIVTRELDSMPLLKEGKVLEKINEIIDVINSIATDDTPGQ